METTFQPSDNFIVAEIELSYRHKTKPSLMPKIDSPKSAYDIFLQTWCKNKMEFVEQMKVVLLNRNCKALGILELSTGGTTSTICDIKLLFAAALKANADSFILAHNHPSGNLHPSEADKKLTALVAEAGKIMQIKLADHLIVTSEGFFSFKEEGLL